LWKERLAGLPRPVDVSREEKDARGRVQIK
jgi:hypothetical protein